jgi:hypothetical protein
LSKVYLVFEKFLGCTRRGAHSVWVETIFQPHLNDEARTRPCISAPEQRMVLRILFHQMGFQISDVIPELRKYLFDTQSLPPKRP